MTFKIFDNPALSGKPVDSGEAFTSYDVDFTVKVEAQHLKPDSKYWYQFSDCTNSGTTSPIGATRTISGPDSTSIHDIAISSTDGVCSLAAPAEQVNGGKPLTLAVFSCARYQDGR